MIYHFYAFISGFIIDQLIGDPVGMPHPIRLIGNFISFLESRLLKDKDDTGNRIRGILLCIIVIIFTAAITVLILFGAYSINIYLGVAAEAVLTGYTLAAKSLRVESMKVFYALNNSTIEDAIDKLSMIVGRDTARLDEKGIIKAAVETVAENTSDGVIAPLLYVFLGGPVLGFVYKAINTMDSMIGYHNDRYEYFGRAAARLDDAANFIPSRVSALFMVAAAFLGKEFSGRDALRIFLRDRNKHKSPNAAQTESVCAGALRVRLAGDAVYFGKIVKKPYIGDDLRPVERDDIKRACHLMYLTEYLCLAFLIVLVFIIRVL